MVSIEQFLAWKRCRRQFVSPSDDDAVRVYAGREYARVTAAALLLDNPEVRIDAPTLASAVEQTQEHIKDKSAIGAGVLALGRLAVPVEVIRYSARQQAWELYLYRAATGIRGIYFAEAALALAAAAAAGLPVASIHVMYLAKTYRRGESIDPTELFLESNVTRRASRLVDAVRRESIEFAGFLDGDRTISVDYRCERGCHLCVPRPRKNRYSVLTLHKGAALGFELLENGVSDLRYIPADVRLSEHQKCQIKAVRSGKTFVDCDVLSKLLDRLEFPLAFLDFEAYAQSLPPMRGLRPYEHCPSIASIHVVKKRGQSPIHLTVAVAGAGDERSSMMSWLQRVLGNHGSVVVFNSAFEAAMLRHLGEMSGRSDAAESIVQRLWDLQVPFQRFAVYHPDQLGKTSLKRVLPALTGSDYGDLNVQDGMEANLSYLHYRDAICSSHESFDGLAARAAESGDPADRKYESLSDIVAYCGLDTMAMVKLVAELWELRDVQCRPGGESD